MHDHNLDARGLLCPMPVLKARRLLRDMQKGSVLRILCTDPGAPQDFIALADAGNHSILSIEGFAADDDWAEEATAIFLEKGQ
ncbi:MAG: sulfurtransferase TusA family protein [Pseudomonadota bacterium]